MLIDEELFWTGLRDGNVTMKTSVMLRRTAGDAVDRNSRPT